VLDRDTYLNGLSAGAKLGSSAKDDPAQNIDEALLDADQLAALLRVPATWIEQSAREGRIPCLQFGRWRRFRRSEVEAAVRLPEPKGRRRDSPEGLRPDHDGRRPHQPPRRGRGPHRDQPAALQHKHHGLPDAAAGAGDGQP